MPDTQQTAAHNRARYALLMDRRRVLFELHKLNESITQHTRFGPRAEAHPGLSGLVEDTFARITGSLCGRACQATLPVLERDVAELYLSLANLARVWVALEDEAELEPLITRHYEALYSG